MGWNTVLMAGAESWNSREIQKIQGQASRMDLFCDPQVTQVGPLMSLKLGGEGPNPETMWKRRREGTKRDKKDHGFPGPFSPSEAFFVFLLPYPLLL
jgi:hypothetical protein